jgi:hypothetical protein
MAADSPLQYDSGLQITRFGDRMMATVLAQAADVCQPLQRLSSGEGVWWFTLPKCSYRLQLGQFIQSGEYSQEVDVLSSESSK